MEPIENQVPSRWEGVTVTQHADGTLISEMDNFDETVNEPGSTYDLEDPQDELEKIISKNRQRWITASKLLTFYVPEGLLTKLVPAEERRQAWREKTAIFTLMILMSAVFLALYIVVPIYSCKQPRIYRWNEIDSASNHNSWMILNGYILDVKSLMSVHPTKALVMSQHLGQDVSQFFYTIPPDKIPARCQLRNASSYANYVNASCTFPSTNTTYCHPYIYPPNSTYYYGELAYTWGDLAQREVWEHWFVINGRVYNTTLYYTGAYDLLGPELDQIVYNRDKMDATDLYYYLFQNDNYLECFDVVFYAGRLDPRSYTLCFAMNTILFSVLVLVLAVIVVKFGAAILTQGDVPYKLRNRYVIINIPCYTEDGDSMFKTIHAAATMMYPHKHKLLLIVCDGLITGKGNEKSTPELVLDIFGRRLNETRATYEYDSLQGPNRCKVFTGFYKEAVPYMVIVKVGMPAERCTPKPGNRGKRDSQIIILSLLNKIFYNRANQRINSPPPQKILSPLEVKMQHDIEHIIGVHLESYEYMMTIDSDTKPDRLALANMVYRMDDKDIIALCGETRVDNKWDSWVTVIQVYEYYVNHHLNKAFESLFGTVTCLPGCFSLYRIKFRSKKHGKVKPGIIHNDIVDGYSNRNVNSLHTRNLLQLGEDRFFTTLLLRYFPDKTIKFIHEARCTTVVPNTWSDLISQRRRWINSTIHNLLELLSIPTLRGIACFSIKTVILLDLISTFLLPVSIFYLGYLFYLISTNVSAYPLILIISVSIMIGCQCLIILVRGDFGYLGWFLIYLLAIFVWFIILPIYAIYHMDEFSWGKTRQVELGSPRDASTESTELDDVSLNLEKNPKPNPVEPAINSNVEGNP
jgi:chitin synthase